MNDLYKRQLSLLLTTDRNREIDYSKLYDEIDELFELQEKTGASIVHKPNPKHKMNRLILNEIC